jgi:hypothetical protein
VCVCGTLSLTNDLLQSCHHITVHEEFQKFIQFAHEHPGRYYNNNKHDHVVRLVVGLWCGQVAVARRSFLEHITVFRYLPFRWVRKVPLTVLDVDMQRKVVRDAGQVEYTRLRRNCFPYQDGHGIGISGGEVLEEIDERSTLLYELSVAYPKDPAAKLANWHLIDIEKILFEAWLLNPPVLDADQTALPGEVYHDVSQNPKYSSSIAFTQHTQISWGSTGDWPFVLVQVRH